MSRPRRDLIEVEDGRWVDPEAVVGLVRNDKDGDSDAETLVLLEGGHVLGVSVALDELVDMLSTAAHEAESH